MRIGEAWLGLEFRVRQTKWPTEGRALEPEIQWADYRNFFPGKTQLFTVKNRIIYIYIFLMRNLEDILRLFKVLSTHQCFEMLT